MVSLPDDLWFHIASTYLHKADTSRLSQTCWQIRFVTLPLVFRRLIFTSSSRYWKSYQLKQQLIHVLDQQRCVHLCSQTRLIFTSIRHIELHNWATTQLRYAHIYPSDLNTQSPGSNEALLSSQDYRVKSAELDVRCRWFATYEMIVKLINILPNLRSITFYEAFNNEEFMPKRRYVPFDEPSWVDNESDWSYSMLEFAVPPSSLGTRRVSVPSIIVSHLHSDPSKACKIREAYFTELLTRCSLPLHSLRLVSKFILNLPIRIYSRFNTLQRLAIVGCVDGPEKELWKTHFPIIMKRSSNLRHLDLWPEYGGTRGIEGIELLNLPMLEVVKLYASEIVRISDTPSITRLNMAYFHSWDLQPKSTPPITHICRVDFWCPDTAEKISNKLGMASNLFPNLQQLALTVSVNNDILRNIFEAIGTFHSLEHLKLFCEQRSKHSALPEDLLFIRPTESLQEISFDHPKGHTAYDWNGTNGWTLLTRLTQDSKEEEDDPAATSILRKHFSITIPSREPTVKFKSARRFFKRLGSRLQGS